MAPGGYVKKVIDDCVYRFEVWERRCRCRFGEGCRLEGTYTGPSFWSLIVRKATIVLEGIRVHCRQKRQQRIALKTNVNTGLYSGSARIILFAGRPLAVFHKVGNMPSSVLAL
jgi:orotidine-5'-phosphate decarboxylase